MTRFALKRFWPRVIANPIGCWGWKGHMSPQGYGKLGHTLAHRLSYEIHWGAIAEGMQIDHLCRNRWCVNPRHLESVTQCENILRGTGYSAVNAARTHCVKGHPLKGNNLRVATTKKGPARVCLQCHRERNKESYYRCRYGMRENVPNLQLHNLRAG